MSRLRIIGPIFLTDTINSERYRKNVLEPFVAQLSEREIEHAWFQQDGATAHTAVKSLEFLDGIFANRVISRGIWPARSPDLTPLDYYLWGELKGNVYENNPHTIDELQVSIINNINNITQPVLHKVFDNMKKNVSILAN